MNICGTAASLLFGCSALFWGGFACAQVDRSTADVAGPENSAHTVQGLKEYFVRTVKVTGSFRVRLEAPSGSDFTASPSRAYTLSRIRLGMAFAPSKKLRFFAEAQDSRVEFYRAQPPSTQSDPLDFRQAYIEGGALEGSGFRVRLGRQEVSLGSNRLIAVGDWSNISKNFDVLRGTFTGNAGEVGGKIDVIAGSAVLDDPTRMDRHKPGEHFYVAYTSWTHLIPLASVEPYVMAKTAMNVKSKDGKLGDADTLYGGLRIIGAIPGGFDYSGEAVREGGGYADDTVQAFGYVVGGGWKLPQASGKWPGGKPHLSTDLAWASGDDGRKDGHHQMFDYLYGPQSVSSLTQQVAWRNIVDWRAGVDFLPSARLKVQIDFRDYWLATTQDGLYNGSGVRTVFDVKATSSHVGEGVDAHAIFAITAKTLLGLGVGNIAPGSYLKQSGKTTGYVYPFIYFSRTL